MLNSISTSRLTWKRVSFLVLVFVALFAPPVIPGINLIIPVAVYALARILFKYRSQPRDILSKSGLGMLAKWVVLYFLYYAAVLLISFMTGGNVQSGHYIRSIYSLLLYVPVTIIVVLYILIRARELRYDLNQLGKVFVQAGMIQVVIAFLALLIPGVKDFLVGIMLENTADPLLNTPWLVDIRFFGFANSLLDLFGLGIGLLAVLALFLVPAKGYRYLVYFGLLLVLAVLNARSGLIIGALGFIIFLGYLFITNRKFTLTLTVMALSIIAAGGITLVSFYAPDTLHLAWRDVGSFIGAGDEGTSATLFSDQFWRLPETAFGAIFGTGHSLYGADGYAHSDVGYINDLWRTGVLGMILLYAPFVAFIVKGVKSTKDRRWKFVFIFFLAGMLVFNVKASIWGYSPAMVVVLAMVGYSAYSKKKGLK